MQATVADWDDVDGGRAVLDDGTPLPLPARALDPRLRTLRRGQRVQVRQDPAGAVQAVTLSTLPLPPPLPGHRGDRQGRMRT